MTYPEHLGPGMMISIGVLGQGNSWDGTRGAKAAGSQEGTKDASFAEFAFSQLCQTESNTAAIYFNATVHLKLEEYESNETQVTSLVRLT